MFNDNVEERYALAIERIKEIAEEPGLKTDGFADYFKCIAAFILKMDKLAADLKADVFRDYSLEEYKNLNTGLYEDVIGKAYETSYANPAYAASKLGLSEGRLLSFLYVEIRGMIVYAYEGRMAEMTALMELFVEVYCMCASTEEDCGKPDYKQMKESVYWYVSDYSDDLMEYRVRELLDPELDFATKIIMESDLTDVRYLYRFGEYVTDNEIKTAEYLNSLSEEEIQKMADTFTEGYRIGFELTGKDLSKKKTVNIRYCLGFERLVRAEIKNFEKLGLKPTIYRAAVNTINKRLNIKVGYYGANPNKQMDFDHRFDNALYMDGEFVERKTGALKLAYEKNKELAVVHGGPAVMEVFGETPFAPRRRKKRWRLRRSRRSFCSHLTGKQVRFPIPICRGMREALRLFPTRCRKSEISSGRFFEEVIRINTLDSDLYLQVQQKMIDALDRGEAVRILGTGTNHTDLTVQLYRLNDPEKETIFENCVADVNIPVGEVFTSPVLQGTNGVLHVSRVYLNGLQYKDLEICFADGMNFRVWL